MKKVLFLSLMLCSFLWAVTAQAATPNSEELSQSTTTNTVAPMQAATRTNWNTSDPTKNIPTGRTTTMSGRIVDNLCASAHAEDLKIFAPEHSMECTLKPKSIASGYNLYSQGALYPFDKESTQKIVKFLQQENSDNEVTVEVKQTPNGLHVMSIKNRF